MSDFGLGPFNKTGGLGTQGKTLYYKTDGTGRDSYIKSNNGGMTSAFHPVKGPEVGRCKISKSSRFFRYQVPIFQSFTS